MFGNLAAMLPSANHNNNPAVQINPLSSKSNNDITIGNDQSVSKQSSAAVSNVVSYMKDLDRIQEQQAIYASKIEKERLRAASLNENIKKSREVLLDVKARTKSGKIVKEEGAVHQKGIVKLEHQVQMAKVKLSSARGHNMALKKSIDQLRMDKLIYNQILKDCVRILSNTLIIILFVLYVYRSTSY